MTPPTRRMQRSPVGGRSRSPVAVTARVMESKSEAGTILVVDDSATIRAQVRAALEAEGCFGDVIEADDGLGAFKLAIARHPDLIVCDLNMPRFDGLKLLALFSSHDELSSVPVIMLTAEADVDRKVELLERGASDYLTKPFQAKELVARVGVHLRLKLAQDELRRLNAELEALSNTDGLTGLFNRRYFDGILSCEIARSNRYRTPLGVIMIDLDHFKQVNDAHGHAMGDLVIKNLAAVAMATVRETDVVARYGGEEVVVVAPQTDVRGTAELAERLRAVVAATDHEQGGTTLRNTASFGVACYDAFAEELTAESLLSRADEALYRAKEGGRDRVVVWTPSAPAAHCA